MRAVILVFAIALAPACKKPVPLLEVDKPDPVMHSEGQTNSLWLVVRVIPYGHKELLNLIVAEDGTRERATFVAPAALGLKQGDVIKAYRICYRADEKTDTNGKLSVTDACTDVVTPYAPPTPEAQPK